LAFCVHIVNSNGKPQKGACVVLAFTAFFSGGLTEEHYTNADGHAYFNRDSARDGEECKIFVHGESHGFITYVAGGSVTISV